MRDDTNQETAGNNATPSGAPAPASDKSVWSAERARAAWEAFERDLPELYKERPGEWVAYHGGERLGFGKQRLDLYQECARRGYPYTACDVFLIEPIATDMLLGLGMSILEEGEPAGGA